MAKVLVIDDHAGTRGVIRFFLAQGGHETVEAVNGWEGIEAIAHTHFAVVICDMHLPIEWGLETIRDLDPGLPIIAVSGASEDDNFSPLDHARAIGADAAVSKPFSAEKLLAAVDALLDLGGPPDRPSSMN